jgi:hypothetical protein
MRKLLLGAIGVLAITAAIGAPSAAASVEFGDNCLVTDTTEGTKVTLFEISAPSNTLPVAAPSAGVITKWKVNVPAVPVLISQTVQVLRLNPGLFSAQVIAEDSRNLTGGANSFDVRLPVAAGDRLALFGSDPEFGTLICEVPEPTVIGGYNGSVPVGSTSPYLEVPSATRIPVAAVIEPDADGDGYGDETQDQCPLGAATQAPCPAIALDAYALAGKGSIKVFVSASTEAKVTVSGAAGKKKLKKSTKTVKPGKLAQFKLKLSKSVKKAVANLAPGKSLPVKIKASAKNVAGIVSTDKTKVKLK